MILAYKRILYDLGWYRFKVPPVHHTRWTKENWIHWIDNHGEWLPDGGRIPYLMPEWLRKLGVSLDDPTHYDAGTILER